MTMGKILKLYQFLLLLPWETIANIDSKSTFCDEHYNQLKKEWLKHKSLCPKGDETPCCEDKSYSMNRRWEEIRMLCPHIIIEDTCKKDILLIVDTTRSFNRNPGDFDKMKNFVKNFVKSKSLGVAEDGVHVAFMIFSENKKGGREVQYPVAGNDMTKMVVKFEQSASYNKMKLVEEMDKEIVKSALGGSTRTDVALRLANEVFEKDNPLNNREKIQDVVILVTDGAPTGLYFKENGVTKTTEQLLREQADNLKDKGVKIIGVGIGEEFTKKKKNRDLLRDLSSPDQFYSVNTDNLNGIIGSLVAKSCNIKPATCKCPDTRSGTYFLKPGQSTIKVDYFDGKPTCDPNNVQLPNPKVEPANKKSGSEFGPGDHAITYTYEKTETTNKLVCDFKVDVRDCSCTSSSIGPSLTVPTGQNEMKVSWTVPRPKCLAKLLSGTESKVTKTLKIGKHSYAYDYKVGTGNEAFTVICPVEFEIKGHLCGEDGFDPDNEMCCCGVKHEKLKGYKCCGKYQYGSGVCCSNGQVVRAKKEDCPRVP